MIFTLTDREVALAAGETMGRPSWKADAYVIEVRGLSDNGRPVRVQMPMTAKVLGEETTLGWLLGLADRHIGEAMPGAELDRTRTKIVVLGGADDEILWLGARSVAGAHDDNRERFRA